MRDITNPRLMILKAVLLLAIGLLASTLVIIERPTLITIGSLVLAIWAFCRLYYFFFYVIEKYIDPSFRFVGLGAAIRYMLKTRTPVGK